jgi:hypothetical protein
MRISSIAYAYNNADGFYWLQWNRIFLCGVSVLIPDRRYDR